MTEDMSNVVEEVGSTTVSGEAKRGVVTFQGAIYPAECDHMDHFNVAFYMRKFDECNWSNFASVGIDRRHMEEHGVGMGAMESRTKYLRELFAGDVLTCRSRILEVHAKVIRTIHEMWVVEDGVEIPAASCELVIAYFDRKVSKARPFPEDVKARLMARWEKERDPAVPDEAAAD